MTAVRHRLDLFGILVLSLAAATFGGIRRDVTDRRRPTGSSRDWRYIADCRLSPGWRYFPRFIRLLIACEIGALLSSLDGGGFAFFAVSGALKALPVTASPPVAAIMLGVLTGVGGGIARDVLVAEIPTVLRAELYAVAALAGASVVVIGNMLQASVQSQSRCAGGGLCFGLRFMAIRRGWHLPLRLSPGGRSSRALPSRHKPIRQGKAQRSGTP